MDKLENRGIEIPLLEAPHPYSHTPRRILYAIFKHKLLIATTFLVLSLPVLTITLLRPTYYRATSKVFIKPSRAFLNVSPTQSDQALSVLPSPQVINSEIQIIKSRALMQRLVKEVPFPNHRGRVIRSKPTEAQLSKQAEIMKGRLKVRPVRMSNLIQINLSDTNPEWAAQVVNRAAELYLVQHLKVHQTPGLEKFYDEQEAKLTGELKKSEKVLQKYQEREQIVDAEKELASSLLRLASFETNLRNTESGIREAEEKIRTLNSQLKKQQATVSSSKDVTINPVYRQIVDRLTKLELERNSLLQRYTRQDRSVQNKESEIADLKKRLATVRKTAVGSERISINQLRQNILSGIYAARVQLESLKQKRNTLSQQLARYQSEASELKRKSFVYDRLLQEVNAKKAALSLYKKKAEEARISDAMDKQKFGNATILEEATLPLRPVGFPLWIMIVVIVMISFAIAIGGAFVIEFFNRTVRNETDIEEEIGLPILATIYDYKN